jgi:hypothetical protein
MMLGQRRFGKIQTALLVIIALVMGASLISPAVAHFRPKLGHIIKHVFNKADPRYVNGSEADFVQTGAAGIFHASNTTGGGVPTGEAAIGSLTLPAGNYAVFAKVLIPEANDFTETRCRLTFAGGSDSGDFVAENVNGSLDTSGTIALQLVGAGPGTATVLCNDFGDADAWDDLRITAIRAPSIQSVAARSSAAAQVDD